MVDCRRDNAHGGDHAIETPQVDDAIEARWAQLDVGEKGEAAELIMAAAKLGGVDHLWFVSGSELTFFQEASAKAKALGHPAPRIMTMLHEHAALSAAMGESMVSGKPSSATAHVDLGLLNMGGAIHNAYRGGAPILIMTGVPAASYPGSGPGSRSSTVFWKQQIRDQGELVRQYMKWDWKLAPYDNAGLTVTRALQVATSQPTGPVYLAIPRESGQWPLSGIQRFPTLDYLTRPSPPAADPSAIRAAARLLIAAERPYLMTDRMGRNAHGPALLVELAELLGARVQCTNHRYNFPQPHPLRASGGTSTSDVIMTIDFPVPWLPGADSPRVDAKVINIDIDPIQLGMPIWEFPADVRITADSTLAVQALLEEIKSQATPEDRRRMDQRRERLAEAAEAAQRKLLDGTLADGRKSHITPRWASHQLAQAIDDDTVMMFEGGHPGSFKRSKPGSIFAHGGASLGFSMAWAIGGKTAAPDRRFVCTIGDGAFNFGLASQCFWAAHHYKTPFMAMVWNNRGFRTGTTSVRDTYPDGYAVRAGDYEGGFFDPPPDYAAEARASGCHAEKVTRPEEVAPAIARALEATDRDGVCSLIDVWLPSHITGEV